MIATSSQPNEKSTHYRLSGRDAEETGPQGQWAMPGEVRSGAIKGWQPTFCSCLGGGLFACSVRVGSVGRSRFLGERPIIFQM